MREYIPYYGTTIERISERSDHEYTTLQQEIHDDMIQHREEGIQIVTEKVRDSNDAMLSVSALVDMQDPMLDTIESNIMSSVTSTAKCVQELKKADKGLSTSNKIVLVLAGVCCCVWFALAIAFFLALFSLNNVPTFIELLLK